MITLVTSDPCALHRAIRPDAGQGPTLFAASCDAGKRDGSASTEETPDAGGASGVDEPGTGKSVVAALIFNHQPVFGQGARRDHLDCPLELENFDHRFGIGRIIATAGFDPDRHGVHFPIP